ncbi:hypothetical protein [Rhodalgimonas zhirmunskyi]|uniref:Uncharacterized protein n=1 Tax=Rhodalgimonas zhirmunskyi TaxID=2964767 RepID=A0AAJ1X6C3_9RHOB|nr:hypothetical protein [Rhodoalgimonas zhirmunskyi]MDQ2093262.1 hypothetical protein [Rhodoalgimonas zhirmunskyi]
MTLLKPFAALALATALTACMSPEPTAEQAAAAGVKPATPAIAATIARVKARAQTGVGRQVAPGITLERVYSRGNTVFFDNRMNPALTAVAKREQTRFQADTMKTFGTKFCRKGTGTRAFLDEGGAIQVVVRGADGTLLSGGRLTGCR